MNFNLLLKYKYGRNSTLSHCEHYGSSPITWSWCQRVSADSGATVGIRGYTSSLYLTDLASLQVAFLPLAHLMSRLCNSSFKREVITFVFTMSLNYGNHFFFFFSRRYNPWWVLACFTISFHNLLSLHFSLQFLTFIFFKSSSTWSSHLSLGLPTGLDEHGSHSVNFLTVLLVSIIFIGRPSSFRGGWGNRLSALQFDSFPEIDLFNL